MKKTNAIRIIERHKIPFQILEYQYNTDNLSVGKIAQVNNLEIAQVFKTLVVKGDKTGIQVALIAGNRSLNFKALANFSQNKKIALIPVNDLLKLTGYIRGGCSPIGMKKQFPVFIDAVAAEFEEIFINAGARGLLVKIKVNDLLSVTAGELVTIGDTANE